MADALPSRVGQINSAGDVKALFLKVFGGEVLTAFAEMNKFLSRHTIRTIDSGKSAQFPVIGKGTASYHTPGTELQGSKQNHSERIIYIDDVLIADRFIASIDEAMNHYDVRSVYSNDCARALAKQFDQHVAQVGYLTARASATVTGGVGGSVITDADADTNATSLIASVFEAMEDMDLKDVPDELRSTFVGPDQYYQLVNIDKAINRDFGGRGVFEDGKIWRVAGTAIVKTNNLPTSVIGTGPTLYQGDFSTSVALVMHPDAVGTVKLIDLAVETEYDMRRQGYLTLAKYAMGHGILRPECSVEIKTA